jgi:hypothetical protein
MRFKREPFELRGIARIGLSIASSGYEVHECRTK